MIELLARPYQGRWIAGVCSAIANAYGVPRWLVRVIAVVGFFAAPILLLVYLLLAISIPSERSVAGSLYLSSATFGAAGFRQSASLLLDRTSGRLGSGSNRQRTIVPLLFLLTLVFGLPKIEGTTFYSMHPLMDGVFTLINRVASVICYFVIGLAFLVRSRNESNVALRVSTTDDFALDASDFKSIAGIAIAISRATSIDVGIVRLMLLALNLLTLGVVGALYFLTVWLMRNRARTASEYNAASNSARVTSEPSLFNAVMAAIFILLAIVRVATEFRWFFFNEPFVRGLLLCIAGGVLSRRTLPLATITGAVLLFLGVHDITVASFHVQPTAADRWSINYVIVGLSIGFYALVALAGRQRLIAFALATLPLLAAALVATHLISEPFLLALGRFYDFFSPLVFAALALWVAMES